MFIDTNNKEPLLYYQPSPYSLSVLTMLEDINNNTNYPPSTLSPLLVKETNLSELDKLLNRILSPNRLNLAPTILDDYREAIVQQIINQLLYFHSYFNTSY